MYTLLIKTESIMIKNKPASRKELFCQRVPSITGIKRIKTRYSETCNKVGGYWKGKRIEIIRKKIVSMADAYDIVLGCTCRTVPGYKLQKAVPGLLEKFEELNKLNYFVSENLEESHCWLKIKIPRKSLSSVHVTLKMSI